MMIFNSLKSRIIISVMGIVAASLAITTLFFGQRATHELSDAIEGNALNLLKATKNHVESQYNSILYHKSVMLSRRKTELENNTIIAFAIINSAYRDYVNGQLTEDTAKQRAMTDLRQLRYDDGTGYFWINDTTRPYPRMIMHPTIPELDGMVLDDPKFNYALGKKENLFKAFLEVCLEKEAGYVDYLWPKPIPGGLTQQQPKISYVKLFKPWNWIIGTGVYIDDIEKDVQNRIDAVVEDLNKTIVRQRIGKSGYFFIFNEDNYMLVHLDLAGEDGSHLINPMTGTRLLDELKNTAFRRNHFMTYLWDKPGCKEGEYRFAKKAYVTYYEPLGWYICSSVYKDDFEQKISALMNTIILFSACFLVIALMISLLVSRSITNPLNMLIRSISKTDTDGIPIDIIPETGTTEIKVLGVTMNNMIDSVSKSRKALKAQRDFSLGIINGAPHIICGLDPDGITSFINLRGEQTTGYCKEEIIGKNWWKLFYPGEDYKQAEQLFEKFATDEVADYEMTLTCKDGERKTILWNSLVKRDHNGKMLEIIGFGNDITERRHAEERFRILSKISPVGIFVTDVDGKVTYCNDRLYEISGMSMDEGKGSGWANGIHPDDKERVFAEWCESARARANFKSEYRIVDQKGHVTWAIGQAVAMKDSNGDILGFVGSVTDITERRHAEEEIRHLRNYLSNIIDSMPSVLVGVDIDGRVTQWNKTAEQITGIGARVAQGKNLSDVFPRIASEMGNVTESIRTRKARQERKKPCISENGICYEDVTIYPLIDNGSEGAVIRIDDVTEKVRMEEMMVQSEKMLSVGGLAAGMAHEINNPLAAMIQTANVMANRLGGRMDMPANLKAAEAAGISMEAIRKFMEARGIPRMLLAIRESGRRVAAIVDNMLSFARKNEDRKSSYALEELIDKSLELAAADYDLKKQYDFKMMEIRKEYEENMPAVPCEGAKIRQVLLNIFRNGAHAMQDAGTKTPLFVVRTRLEKDRKMVCMEIEDNGPGMDEATRKRVFEPFFTTKPVGVGTGLGLSVSYFIITENHDGEMAVESRAGSGAKFIIRLPL